MLGANACLACGLHRRHGWRIVALAGVAAIAPDWDGLTVVWDAQLFDQGHRVWGHNIFSCFALAILLTIAQLRCDFLGQVARLLVRIRPFQQFGANVGSQVSENRSGTLFLLVSYLACLSQIPADAVVSGGRGLSDWEIKPLWPVSNWSIVYGMVPWGNVGITIIFAISMILMAKFKQSLQQIAIGTLVCVVGYILAWGLIFR